MVRLPYSLSTARSSGTVVGYLLRRLAHLVPVLLGVTVISFALMNLSPSDPALMMLNSQGVAPSEELLAQTRHEMGLDQPVAQRYLSWLGGVLRGDMGYSYRYSAPVAQVLAQRLPVTLVLSLASLALMLAVALPLGIAAALGRNRAVDYLVQAFSFFSLSMPTFWFGLVLIYVFALLLGWLPAISRTGEVVGLVLPTVALSFSYVGRIIGQVRAGLVEELRKPYVEGLVSRGVPMRRIVWCHAVRNALLPAVAVVSLAFGAMLSGSITTEMVFSLQGLGFMSVEAITYRDYELVQGYVLLAAVFYVFVNLLVDMLYCLLNPQVRLQGRVGGLR